MQPVIYYRDSLADEKEINVLKTFFKSTTSRVGIKNKLCICRYSAYPFYKELEEDLSLQGSQLINSYRQHRFVADLGNYTEVLGDLTPKTWNRIELVPDWAFPVVVKGETSGRKFLWKSHMFAENREKAIDILCKLQDDGLLRDQNIYFRQFVKLKTYLVGLNGLPITKEFRVFVCDGKILSKGYYWTNYFDDLPEVPNTNDIPEEFLKKVIDAIGESVRFYAVDVAQMDNGEWIVVELNDGQQSGLSDNDPKVLYKNLKETLKTNNHTTVLTQKQLLKKADKEARIYFGKNSSYKDALERLERGELDGLGLEVVFKQYKHLIGE